MKTKIVFAMLMAAGIMLAACSDDDTVAYVSDGVKSSHEKADFGNIVKNQQDTNLIMPLNVGNYWVYSVSHGAFVDHNTICYSHAYYELLAVVGTEDINGETWYKMQSTTDYGYSQFFYYTNTSTGLFCKLTKDSEPVMLCPYIKLDSDKRVSYSPKNNDILSPEFNTERQQISLVHINKMDVTGNYYTTYVHRYNGQDRKAISISAVYKKNYDDNSYILGIGYVAGNYRINDNLEDIRKNLSECHLNP